MEYAALHVEPDCLPPAVTDVLPQEGAGVIAVAVAYHYRGINAFSLRW